MLTVFKYKLGDFGGQMSFANKDRLPKFLSFTVEMHSLRECLHFEVDDKNVAWLWALVDQDRSLSKEKHKFAVFPTGYLIELKQDQMEYVGTCRPAAWPWVWHLFRILKD